MNGNRIGKVQVDCRANSRVWVLAMLAPLAIAAHCPGQTSAQGNGRAAITSQTVLLGLLVPDQAGRKPPAAVPFHLTIPKNTAVNGYGLSAVVSFTFTPTAAVPGGQSIAASDFGIGLDAVSSSTGPLASATVAPGFERDPTNMPSTVSAGAANGQATLADLLSGREILRVAKAPSSSIPTSGSDLQLTFKIAVPKKYFTPGSFSGSLTVTVIP